MPRIVFELPPFDTGEYNECEFHMVGADATLVVHVSGIPDISIGFRNVRWHRFTQLHNCKAKWIEQAYFRLVEISPDEELSAYVKADTSSGKPYSDLRHYRIFL